MSKIAGSKNKYGNHGLLVRSISSAAFPNNLIVLIIIRYLGKMLNKNFYAKRFISLNKILN